MSLVSKWGPHAARLVLGLLFAVFGLNFFLDFLPAPPTPGARALTFFGGLIASGYVLPLIKSLEVVAALALLTNRFVPLALTVLAPIIVNIAAIHLLLEPAYPLALGLLGLELFLAFSYRAAFAPMLRAHVTPATTPELPLATRHAAAAAH